MIRYLLAGLFLINITTSQADVIRHLQASQHSLKPIYLKVGKATILRFTQAPSHIVLGNPAYFETQFLGNDLIIRPKNEGKSNLFVYSDTGTLSFILRVERDGLNFDDLVYINASKSKKPRKTHTKKFNRHLYLGKRLIFKIDSITFDPNTKVHRIKFKIKNLKNKKLKSKYIKARFRRFNRVFKVKHKLDVNKERLNKHQIVSGRLWLKLKDRKSFTLVIQYKHLNTSIIIPGRFL